MTTWRRRFECWIPKSTNTPSEYAILTDFPLRIWSHERVVSCVDPIWNISWILFSEGRSSELRLRQLVGQAATLSNPQVECTGVFIVRN